MPSKIEWTDESWNPVVGCSKISEGCKNCYAEKMACRLAHMGHQAYQDVTGYRDGNFYAEWNDDTDIVDGAFEKPLKWKKPRRIFVCSMGDLFHRNVGYEAQKRVFEIIRCSVTVYSLNHTFMILTKRPESMQAFFSKLQNDKGPDFNRWPLPNVWLGVTAENQIRADERIPVLLEIPAKVRFVSVEPMLGPVDLASWFPHYLDFSYTTDPARLDWVICGGETGPGARPMQTEWARNLQQKCEIANVPFFFKKHGDSWRKALGFSPKDPANHQLDGAIYREYPDMEDGKRC